MSIFKEDREQAYKAYVLHPEPKEPAKKKDKRIESLITSKEKIYKQRDKIRNDAEDLATLILRRYEIFDTVTGVLTEEVREELEAIDINLPILAKKIKGV